MFIYLLEDVMFESASCDKRFLTFLSWQKYLPQRTAVKIALLSFFILMPSMSDEVLQQHVPIPLLHRLLILCKGPCFTDVNHLAVVQIYDT